MLRSVTRKVLWMGRAASVVLGLALVLALILGAATTALGATGGDFLLGRANTAGAVSKLTANVAGPALSLINTSTNSAATALNLQVASGRPPMKVNSSQKVANLNADAVDGESSSDLLPGGGVPPGTTIRGHYEIDGTASTQGGQVGGDSISFVYALPSKPLGVFVASGATPPAQCPGTADSPEAQPGYLCVYEQFAQNAALTPTDQQPNPYYISPTGANLVASATGAGDGFSYGTWAVTAARSTPITQAAQGAQLQGPTQGARRLR